MVQVTAEKREVLQRELDKVNDAIREHATTFGVNSTACDSIQDVRRRRQAYRYELRDRLVRLLGQPEAVVA